jgi:hypothetical protein
MLTKQSIQQININNALSSQIPEENLDPKKMVKMFLSY